MNKRLVISGLVSLLIACQTGFLRAQNLSTHPDMLDMSLEDLMKVEIDSVYGASGYKQKITDAPAAITIVTADEIRRYGYRTLAEVLRGVPGFYVTYDRNYDYLGVRGFGRPGDYNSRLLLLVDGHRVNDNIYDQAFVGGDFPVDIDLIDRVEVIRGPNSSLYVASAYLGVINVITRPVHDQEGLTAEGELASYGTYKSRLTYGHAFRNGSEMLLSGSFYDSAGQNLFFQEFASPDTNHGIARNCDYEEYHQIFANLSRGGLRLEGAYGSREKGIPTASYGDLFNDPAARTVDARGYADLAYDHKFGSDWGYKGRVYYDHYLYDGFYPYAADPPGPVSVLNKDVVRGQWWGAEFAFSKQLSERQTAIVGSEFRDNFQQYQTSYDEMPYFSYGLSKTASNLWALFAQDAIRLPHHVTLNLGLRHDQYSTFGGTTNPRAALLFQPFEKTTLKLLYAQSFRAPNAYELFYAGVGQEGNLGLRPETVRTMELVLGQNIPGNLQLLVSGYYYPLRGLINQGNDPANGDIIYLNSQQINMRGVEIALKKQAHSGLEAGASLSLQDAEQVGRPEALANSPKVLGQSNVSVPLFRGRLFASISLDCVSRRRTTAGNYAAAYALPNFTLFSRAIRHWEAAASLYNAFNQRYGDPGSLGDPGDIVYQDGRTFRVRFACRY